MQAEQSFVEGGATSFMSMFRTMDRSTVTMLRDNTAERLATTVQVLSWYKRCAPVFWAARQHASPVHNNCPIAW
jgi:hypothetical protein